MSISYADLEAEVLGFLQIESADKDKFQVQSTLNRALDYLQNSLPLRFLKNAQNEVTQNLTSGEDEYAFPADYCRFVSLKLDYAAEIGDTNKGRPAEVILETELDDFSNKDRLPTAWFPQVAILKDKFVIRPIPGADQTKGYHLVYVKKHTALAAGQNFVLGDDLRNLLVFRSTFLSAAVDNFKPEVHDKYRDLFEAEWEKFMPKVHEE